MDYSNMKAKQVSKKKTYSYQKEQPKKTYSYEKDLQKAARSMKKSSISWLVVILFLIIGVVGGFFAHKYAFVNDTYYMVAYADGKTDITIGEDEAYQAYTELGVKCVSFGKDLSGECTVTYYYRSDLTSEKVKVDKVDETIPGMYYAVYSTNASKYKSVTLIRNILVMREEG